MSRPTHDRETTAPRRGRLRAELARVVSLTDTTRMALWELYRAHYERVDEARFFADLDGKRDIILLRDPRDQALYGFSTLDVSEHRVGERRFTIVFSGDTLVAASHQGQSALHRAFVGYVLKVALRSRHPVYWLLISKGYKTYLLLSRNFPEHWPRCDRETPPHIVQLLDVACRDRFGAAWDPGRGIVQFVPPGPRLIEGVSPLPPEHEQPPDIRFFVARNPGHAEGDELCCLGRVNLKLGLGFGWRLLRKRLGAVRTDRRNSIGSSENALPGPGAGRR